MTMMDKMKKIIAVALIVIFAVLADQGTKMWAEDNLASFRYPDHQIEVTVTPEQAGKTLEDFVRTKYPSLNAEDALRVVSSATRNGERLRATDALAGDDKIAFNHVSQTVIDGYFDYQYARNPGAAWSFLADQSDTFRKWFFGITGWIAVIAMGIFIAISKWKTQKMTIITLACVLGGAFGNMIDRFRMGYVIDFISWHIGDAYWPTFNIADVFVTGGIALLIIDMMVHHKDEPEKTKVDDSKSDEVSPSSEAVASSSDEVSSSSEAVASPSEAVASPSEAVSSPSEAVASPSEAVASPSESVASPSEAVASSSDEAVSAPVVSTDGEAAQDKTPSVTA